MSKHDLIRFEVINQFNKGEISREEAGLKLELSTRQITRISKKVREQGLKGVKHGNIGRTPWNKISEAVKKKFVETYDLIYSKFNYFHGLEMMGVHSELKGISYSTFRKACRLEGVGKTKKRRTKKARLARARHFQEGYMWQLDGSPEAWESEKKSSLIALIDDATSILLDAQLYPSETTWACMNVVRKAIEKYGIPEFILTDKAGWSAGGGRKRKHFSQFEAACKSLGITVIATSSPESKGRVERLNRTCQDRLIPELDFFKIKGLKDSNRYLEQSFIPDWNKRFTVEATNLKNRYRQVPEHLDLKDVFCYKMLRHVNRNHIINYKAKLYLITPEEGKTYKGKQVTIREYEDKSISVTYGNERLKITEFKQTRKGFQFAS